MRVLLLADHCNPEMASTPFFGFKICQAIGRRVQATLVTQIRNRDAMGRTPPGDFPVEFVDSEYVARRAYWLSKTIRRDANKALTFNVALSYPSSLAFEWEVWKRFKRKLHAGEFDVVHRVTPLSPTSPSLLAKWSPVPVVLGPVNGALPWPKAFSNEFHREREWARYLRGIYKMLPYTRSSYRKAAAILAGFEHTIRDLPASVRPRVLSCPDVGCDAAEFPTAPLRTPSKQMTVLFVGRFVPYKCADVVLCAFAASTILRQHKLVLIGDGPDRPMLEDIIRENNLQDCANMPGWLAHDRVMEVMAQSHVFAFPSIRELGAGVVIEAMAAGMAGVVVDYGGPGAYMEPARGIKIALENKPQMIADYRAALEALATDPARRAATGLAAHEYATTRHSWDAKAAHIVETYDWVLGRRPERPDFFAPVDISPLGIADPKSA